MLTLKEYERVIDGRLKRRSEFVDEIYEAIKEELNPIGQKYDMTVKTKLYDVLDGWSIRGRKPLRRVK